MIKNILFDLDSTLLQMDQDQFLNAYLTKISTKVYQVFGYNPKEFVDDLMQSTYKMITNAGIETNETVFWDSFSQKYKDKNLEKVLEEFYNNEFNEISKIVNYNPLSRQIVELCRKKGYNIVLATNPIFPKVATLNRMKWAGLDEDLFDYITTYENCSYSKPNNDYYLEICDKLNFKPSETLMVGNDVGDDFKYISEEFSKYLVTDYLINTENLKITMKNGSLEELYLYLESL